jgi:predicted RNA polymerase sigma factor
MAALELAARPADIPGGGAGGDLGVAGRDDTLVLLFLCCHPRAVAPSQLALTLRAVGGLTTAQIAAAFLVPEVAIAKRIARAKQRISDAGARFQLPAEPARSEQLGVVMQVLYLIFNEGYTTSSGPALQRADLTAEAIRLARLLHQLLPGEAEVAGLLALMLLTDARRVARTDPDGRIVPLAGAQKNARDLGTEIAYLARALKAPALRDSAERLAARPGRVLEPRGVPGEPDPRAGQARRSLLL